MIAFDQDDLIFFHHFKDKRLNPKCFFSAVEQVSEYDKLMRLVILKKTRCVQRLMQNRIIFCCGSPASGMTA